jgi:hypothetical protein
LLSQRACDNKPQRKRSVSRHAPSPREFTAQVRFAPFLDESLSKFANQPSHHYRSVSNAKWRLDDELKSAALDWSIWRAVLGPTGALWQGGYAAAKDGSGSGTGGFGQLKAHTNPEE